MLYEWASRKTAPKDGFGSFRGPRQSSVKRSPAPPLTTDRIAQRPRIPSPLPTSIHQPSRVSKSMQRRPVEEDETDAPTDVEVRIAELSNKIDRLTAMVAGLQSGAGIETVRS